MQIGTALFLSALVLGFIHLFIRTRESWRWKRIAFVAFCAVVMLPMAIWGGITTYTWWDDRPKPINSYLGISPGAPHSDVVFLLGKPDQGDGSDLWLYNDNGQRGDTLIKFEKGRVRFIAALSGSHEPFNGVSIGDTYQSVIERLGEPEVVSRTKDETSRLLNYPTLRMGIDVTNGVVTSINVYDGIRPLRFMDDPVSD